VTTYNSANQYQKVKGKFGFSFRISVPEGDPLAVELCLIYWYSRRSNIHADASFEYNIQLDHKVPPPPKPAKLSTPQKLVLIGEMYAVATFFGDADFEGILTRKFRSFFNRLSCTDLVETIELLYSDKYESRACFNVFRELLALAVVREKYDRVFHPQFDSFRALLTTTPQFGVLLAKVDLLNDEHQGERQAKRNFKVEHIDDLPDEI
jgi:hypothetical protein